MSGKDVFHDVVRRSLEKDGWTITDDPLRILVEEVELLIDLGAEELLAAEKSGAKIAVEIKTFLQASAISTFHTALGQFLNYQEALELEQPERTLYLAIPNQAYKTFFARRFVQRIVSKYQLKLLIYDPKKEVIVEWRN
ncbi:XisH family protein [Calothrix sp. NIES-3974]|uniref:XisH family protein n=1 Tax=Calothrix sp. NIES-3974 TaxID=2005462 RepID=UPI000B622EA8|nr:XisH family protein [Calothrix sp. NIES-3974]BAZ06539.1 fdxN element excision controlling factor protein XisH [Calothrix sp. NIES-3974]